VRPAGPLGICALMFSRVKLGHGVGLRTRHYGQFLSEQPGVEWVEAISENFMGQGGRPLRVLEKVRRDRPVVLHGVGLGIGSVAPFDQAYLREWKEAGRARSKPALVFGPSVLGAHGGRYAHDLLPLPFTEEALGHVVERVKRVQDHLGRQLLLENVFELPGVPAVDDDRVGVSLADRRARRLRHSARPQQHLRQRAKSRVRRRGVSERRAGGARRPVPPRGQPRSRRHLDRHPRGSRLATQCWEL